MKKFKILIYKNIITKVPFRFMQSCFNVSSLETWSARQPNLVSFTPRFFNIGRKYRKFRSVFFLLWNVCFTFLKLLPVSSQTTLNLITQ